MGVDTIVYIKKSQLKKLFNLDIEYFYFLMLKVCYKRWHNFIEMFDLEDIDLITSKELLRQIALNPKLKLKARSWWVNILSEYDLIFAKDTLSIEDLKNRIENFDEYVDLGDLEQKILETARREIISNIDK